MPSIKHFRDLSLENKLRTYTALQNGDVTVSEKKDGVFIGFRFGVPVNVFSVPKFPPILEFKSYNSPWVKSGTEYLEWAGAAKFSTFFAQVIDKIVANEKLCSMIKAEMVLTSKEIMTAELFSMFVAEHNTDQLLMKMVRTWYPLEHFKDNPEMTLFFHGARTLKSVPKFPLFQMFETEVDKMLTDRTLASVLSMKAENREFRRTVDTLITAKVESLMLKAYVLPDTLEGVIIDAYECQSKVVHPEFFSWPLNKVLFEGEPDGR